MAIFIVTARPTGPTWVMVGPMASRYGRTRSSSAASPPTMIESWPCSSVAMLPETGPSRKVAPAARDHGPARARAMAGLTVLISTQAAPGRRPAITPSVPWAMARERARVGDHAEDHVRRLRDAARGGGELHARGDERLRLGGGAVVADERDGRRRGGAAPCGCPWRRGRRSRAWSRAAAPGLAGRAPRRARARRRDGRRRGRPAGARGCGVAATAIAEISTLQFACVASRDTSTVVVVGRCAPRYEAHTRLRSSCSRASVR